MLEVWMLKRMFWIVCYEPYFYFHIVTNNWGLLSWSLLMMLNYMIIPLKELQMELQQLCSINAAIYQPLYEMAQVIWLDIGFEMFWLINLSSLTVYLQRVMYLCRALLVGWNRRNTSSKNVIFTTMYHGKLRILPFCIPLFIIILWIQFLLCNLIVEALKFLCFWFDIKMLYRVLCDL